MYGNAFVSAGTEGSIYILSISAGTLTRNRILGYLAISSSYIGRDVICMPQSHLRKTKVTWQFFSLVRANRFCIHSQITSKETVIKKSKTQSQGSSRQSANSGKFGFLKFLRYEDLLK